MAYSPLALAFRQSAAVGLIRVARGEVINNGVQQAAAYLWVLERIKTPPQ